jgi:Icc-related predicted phosphoesterase
MFAQVGSVRMTRILAVSDEESELLYGDALHELRPDLLVACGDLNFDYLENLVSRTDRPLLYVPGNHDPDLSPPDAWSPLSVEPVVQGVGGGENIDGRLLRVADLTFAGLGGSIRYRRGPNQYTQAQMTRRALRMEVRGRLERAFRGRPLDVLVCHSPPFGAGDARDPAHAGFHAFHRLIRALRPRLLIHGHVHGHLAPAADLKLGDTLVVNAIPYRLIEL